MIDRRLAFNLGESDNSIIGEGRMANGADRFDGRSVPQSLEQIGIELRSLFWF